MEQIKDINAKTCMFLHVFIIFLVINYRKAGIQALDNVYLIIYPKITGVIKNGFNERNIPI